MVVKNYRLPGGGNRNTRGLPKPRLRQGKEKGLLKGSLALPFSPSRQAGKREPGIGGAGNG